MKLFLFTLWILLCSCRVEQDPLIYNIDKNASDSEKLATLQAIEELNIESNSNINIKLIESDNYLTQTNLIFLKDNFEFDEAVLGYFSYFKGKRIFIFSDRIQNYRDLKQVIMHEIGHSLGLEHSKTKFTLMAAYQEDAVDFLSVEDLMEFCKIHTCMQ